MSFLPSHADDSWHQVTRPTFVWPNHDRLLVAEGDSGYVWVDHGLALPSATPLAVIGGAPERSGVVAVGDGLDAVAALTERGLLAPGTVRVVYIDPPFNTGRRFGHYDDALEEATWLSLIRDRLAAVAPYIGQNGSVWVHLDEAMGYKARLLLDSVFGSEAYVTTVVWQKRTTVDSRTAFSSSHDTIAVYAPAGPKAWKQTRNRVPSAAVEVRNRDDDERGPWRDAPFTAPGYRAGQQYEIVTPTGVRLMPPRGRSWFATEPVFKKLLAEGRIWWPKGGSGQPRLKNFAIDAFQVPGTIWSGKDVGTNDDAKRHLAELFPESGVLFDTPKPEQLLARILHIASNPGDLIVDLFAGSGTTAAVAHKMGRRWIVAERMTATVSDVLVPRLSHVVAGTDPGGVTRATAWSGGGAFEVVEVLPVTHLAQGRNLRRGSFPVHPLHRNA